MNEVDLFFLRIADELEASIDESYDGTTNAALQLAANVLRGYMKSNDSTKTQINLLGIGINQQMAARLSADVEILETPKKLADIQLAMN